MNTVSLSRFKGSLIRATESQLVRVLSNNARLLWDLGMVKSHKDFVTVRSLVVKRLCTIRTLTKTAADNAVQQRISRSIALNRADKAERKSVATLISQAKEGVLITPEMILEVEAKLGFQLSEGALKAIFFAYVNKGYTSFDLAIQFAESVGNTFVLSVFKTIRFMERTAVRAMMIAKGLLSTGKAAVSKALAVAFAVAKTA